MTEPAVLNSSGYHTPASEDQIIEALKVGLLLHLGCHGLHPIEHFVDIVS